MVVQNVKVAESISGILSKLLSHRFGHNLINVPRLRTFVQRILVFHFHPVDLQPLLGY